MGDFKPIKKKESKKADKSTGENQGHEEEQSLKDAIQMEIEKPLLIRWNDAIRKKISLRMNVVRDRIEAKLQGSDKWVDMDDRMLNDLWIQFQLDGTFRGKSEKPAIGTIKMIMESSLTELFNPFEAYFKSLKYTDGHDYIAELADSVKIADMDLADGKKLVDYWPRMLKRWLVASVACSLGVKENQCCLTLLGGQGKGKTYWLDHLCPPPLYNNYRHTGHIDLEAGNSKALALLSERFLINIDDQLDSIFGKDYNKIKGYISANMTNSRRAYAVFDRNRPRIANFVASVNNEKIFRDVENRRYLTFQIEDIDKSKKIDMDMVWAQAFHLYQKGDPHTFGSADFEIINQINAHFTAISLEEEWLELCFEPLEPVHCDPEKKAGHAWLSYAEVFKVINDASGLKLQTTRVHQAMKRLGWSRPQSKYMPVADGKKKMSVYAYPVRMKYRRDHAQKIILESEDPALNPVEGYKPREYGKKQPA